MNQHSITLQDIIQTHKQIQPYIHHTPLEYNEGFSHLYKADIYLKLENLQVTGSFKARGSLNRLFKVVHKIQQEIGETPSAGNHGIGLAYAAKNFNVPAHVYLPKDADQSKIHALKKFGALLSFFDTIEEARIAAMQNADETGKTFLSAYNDPAIIKAGGTVALEIIEDLSNVDVVMTCMGGGGLTSGVCLALKSINPKIEVWAVQTKNSPSIATWHERGQVTHVDLKTSIAEGLSGPIDPETMTFPIIHQYIDRILTVTEEEIVTAMKVMLESQYIVEPSGAAGVAALYQCGRELKGRKVAIIVTGRNISWSRLKSIVDKIY